MLLEQIRDDVLRANDNILNKEVCEKDIDYLVEIRRLSGEPISYEEKRLTEYYIKKFIRKES